MPKGIKTTTEDFIKQSKECYGNKFNYSETNFITYLTPLLIICPEHGLIQIRPRRHFITYGGCPKCSSKNSAKILRDRRREELLLKCQDLHNNMFDYDISNYINTRTKINIYCKKHSKSFKQSLYGHSIGKCGCVRCLSEKKSKLNINCNPKHKKKSVRLTQDEFIKQCKKIHNNRYTYEQVVYKGMAHKILITCKIHGTFEMLAGGHFHQKYNCRKCINAENSINTRKTKKQFIKEAQRIHGERYNYDKVVYVTSDIAVSIFCKEHKIYFKQDPHSHLKGSGCSQCARESLVNLTKKTKEQFIKDSKEVHGNLYNYSKVNYKSSRKKVLIICNKHGEFFQNPIDHVHGSGCPTCNNSSLELIAEKFMNNNNIKFKSQVTYDDCIHKRRLRFDFAILDESNNKIKCLLEMNGLQHYQKVDFFGGEKQFKSQQKRDKIKRDYCKKNDIPLIEVKYDVKNIPKYLDKALKALD